MTAREIVTLQFGHYSNFIGTHWWNLQESSFVYDPKVLTEFPKEVNHDVLFREGRTTRGDITFTPRLVLFDLNKSLGSLKKEGTLYDVGGEDDIKWLGDVTLHQTVGVKKNKFLQDLDEENNEGEPNDVQGAVKEEREEENSAEGIEEESSKSNTSLPDKSEEVVFGHKIYNLDDDVKVWSDYLRTSFHPRTVHLLKGHQHNDPDQPFNIFGLGQQAGEERSLWDEIEDKVRYFTEECDYLQGFQILLDSYNAFGGLASTVLSYLADEYSCKSKLSFAVTPACPPDQTAVDRSARILNSALSLYHCTDHSSAYIPLSLSSKLWQTLGTPLSFPHLEYKADLDYHTSAILAASIDTATMPYRRESEAFRMTDITASLNVLGRKVSALNTTLPFPLRLGSSFSESLMSHADCDPWLSLTPNVSCSSSPWFQSCVVRGIPSSMVKSASPSQNSPRLLSSCTTVDDVMRLYLAETYPGSLSVSHSMRDGVNVGTPYPHIFSPNVNYRGFLTDSSRSPQTGVASVPTMTSMQSTTDVHSYIDSLDGCVSRFNIHKHQHFIEAGLEPDDFTEMLHGLKSLAQNYRANEDG